MCEVATGAPCVAEQDEFNFKDGRYLRAVEPGHVNTADDVSSTAKAQEYAARLRAEKEVCVVLSCVPSLSNHD